MNHKFFVLLAIWICTTTAYSKDLTEKLIFAQPAVQVSQPEPTLTHQVIGNTSVYTLIPVQVSQPEPTLTHQVIDNTSVHTLIPVQVSQPEPTLTHQVIDKKFNQLESKLNKTDKKIKQGLASTAALTGLFQPYGVGKLNLSVGIGGYQSESSIAIGSGYRFNDNLAAKVGVSAPINQSSSMMYNASLNLEW